MDPSCLLPPVVGDFLHFLAYPEDLAPRPATFRGTYFFSANFF